MRHLLRVGLGLLLASTLSAGLVALPAGAAVKGRAARTTAAASTEATITAVITTLQGKTVTLSDGSTCVISGSTCTIVKTGTAMSLSVGTVLSLGAVGTGIKQAHMLMPAGFGLGLGIGVSGLLGSLELIMFFW